MPDTVLYREHIVIVLDDGRWRFRHLTFETAADCRYYIDHMIERDPVDGHQKEVT